MKPKIRVGDVVQVITTEYHGAPPGTVGEWGTVLKIEKPTHFGGGRTHFRVLFDEISSRYYSGTTWYYYEKELKSKRGKYDNEEEI